MTDLTKSQIVLLRMALNWPMKHMQLNSVELYDGRLLHEHRLATYYRHEHVWAHMCLMRAPLFTEAAE